MNKIKTTQKVKKKKKKIEERDTRGLCTDRRPCEEMAIKWPSASQEEKSEETNFPDTSILDFQALEL